MVMLIAGGSLLPVLTTRTLAHQCRCRPSTPSAGEPKSWGHLTCPSCPSYAYGPIAGIIEQSEREGQSCQHFPKLHFPELQHFPQLLKLR